MVRDYCDRILHTTLIHTDAQLTWNLLSGNGKKKKSGFLIEIWKFINEVYCLIQGSARPQQNSTIDVASTWAPPMF